ncbi:MAG TPA: histidine triad nucleotide-binding protein [Oligoflexia bacterium]|nr:histidine triad nucleotide-binding protein [Oligoflexia bacterium]HMP49014.1 histidine triad nucleotide-binding protein [Oligoflexia bacterium]
MAEKTIFHRIISRELPATIIFEDEISIAFKDINPAAPVHILVVPKSVDIPRLDTATEEHQNLLGHLLLVCNKVAKSEGLIKNGYRVVINNGDHALQTVSQLHLHVIGGRVMGWPPG